MSEVKQKDMLEVKQIKQILEAAGVNYSDCTEKHELEERLAKLRANPGLGSARASGGGGDSDDDLPLLARAAAQKAPGPAPEGVEAVPSGGADLETWLGKTAAEVGQMLVGCSISKLFPKHGYFNGEVESFDAQTGMFAVVYDDNDEEMMTLAQLAHCLPKAQEKLARAYLGLPKLGSGQASLGGGAGRGRGGSSGGAEAANAKDRKRGGKRAASPESGSDVEFVEEETKAPDVINISDSESDYSSTEGASEDSEWEDHGRSSKGQAKIKVGKVTIEAFCIDVDDEHGGDGGVKEELGRGDEAQHSEAGVANEEVRKKIRKMLQLGLHPDTPDTEAQQALKNANRFLTRYNLQQVDILKEAEEEGQESSLAGGMKVVLCPCNNRAVLCYVVCSGCCVFVLCVVLCPCN
jgi:hypothetical protein